MNSVPKNQGTSQKISVKSAARETVKTSLLNKEQYLSWRTHRKLLREATCRVDVKAPKLIPEMYMKSRLLEKQNLESENRLAENLKMAARVNGVNRLGGKTDCRLLPRDRGSRGKLLRLRRQRLRRVGRENRALLEALALAGRRAAVPRAGELRIMSRLPPRGPAPRPALANISGRRRCWMRFEADGGIRLGRITVELFDKVCPATCAVFRRLVRGLAAGGAYAGTRVFTIVPRMFCSAGDTAEDNGFGGSRLEGEQPRPENFTLKHSAAGVLSMDVHDNRISGIFNIVFKPMPWLDGRAVVFGRVVAGSPGVLEGLSALGSPLGAARGNPVISSAGWFSAGGKSRRGALNASPTCLS